MQKTNKLLNTRRINIEVTTINKTLFFVSQRKKQRYYLTIQGTRVVLMH